MLCSPAPLWPHPTGPVQLSSSALPVRHDMFELKTVSTPSKAVYDDMREAFQMFQTQLHLLKKDARGFAEWRSVNIHVTIEGSEDPRMRMDTNESYTLSLESKDTSSSMTVEINAASFCGARHGLESLSQLIWYDPYADTLFMMSSARIEDSPQFRYRGLMLDTARNFIPMSELMRTVDAMAACKLNTLHWHVSDSQSFPLELASMPELSEKGVYGQGALYSLDDVYKLVRRARVCGIRVLIEIDTPAHVSCDWNLKEPRLVFCQGSQPWTHYCSDPPCGQMNTQNPSVYDTLEAIYAEIIQLTNVDDLFHIGGDDISESFWKEHVSNSSPKELWLDFTRKVLQRLAKANKGKLPNATLMWSSKYSESFKQELKRYAPHIMLQLRSKSEQKLLKGIRSVISDKTWDLNSGMGAWHEETNGAPYNSWQLVYEHRPWPRGSENRPEGAEVTLWSWTLGPRELDSRLWPRAAALAERLWSDRPEGATRPVHARLDVHRSRLVARGIRAAPLWSMWCTHNPYTCG